MPNSKTTSTLSAPSFTDICLILFVAAIWSSAFTAIKIAIVEFEPIMVAFSRVSLGFIFLLSYILILPLFNKKTAWPTGTKNWVLLAFISLLYTAVPFSLISWGQNYISASLTSILMGSSPLIGYIITHFATKDEKLTPLKFLALALGIIAVYIAVDVSDSTNINDSYWGMAAILLALLCYAISGMLTRKVDNGSTEKMSTAVLGLGTIFLIPALLISDQLPTNYTDLNMDSVWAIVYLGIFPTGLAYLIRFYLIVKIGFTAFLTTIFFIPIFGVLLSAWMLNEALTINIFISLIVVIASLIVTKIASRQALKKQLSSQA
ncbi:MAG: DMT family transporter [Rhizobiales bacterium]|nr:DMT family transporter [Hyphomicrobiales bacterium]